jgi:hypothetical protein
MFNAQICMCFKWWEDGVCKRPRSLSPIFPIISLRNAVLPNTLWLLLTPALYEESALSRPRSHQNIGILYLDWATIMPKPWNPLPWLSHDHTKPWNPLPWLSHDHTETLEFSTLIGPRSHQNLGILYLYWATITQNLGILYLDWATITPKPWNSLP